MDDRFRDDCGTGRHPAQHRFHIAVARPRIPPSLRSKWERAGLINRVGPRSFAMAGSTPTSERAIAAGLADLGGFGVVAGRAGAHLYGLDGFP